MARDIQSLLFPDEATVAALNHYFIRCVLQTIICKNNEAHQKVHRLYKSLLLKTEMKQMTKTE